MFQFYTIKSDNKPKTLDSLNNGFWYYNYNICEDVELRPKDISNPTELENYKVYTYGYVRIKGTPTVTKCYEAVLKAYK